MSKKVKIKCRICNSIDPLNYKIWIYDSKKN